MVRNACSCYHSSCDILNSLQRIYLIFWHIEYKVPKDLTKVLLSLTLAPTPEQFVKVNHFESALRPNH